MSYILPSETDIHSKDLTPDNSAAAASTLQAEPLLRSSRALRSKMTALCGRWYALVAAMMLPAAALMAQSPFGLQATGTSTTSSVTVDATVGGSIAKVEVLTLGVSGLDYTAGSGTSSCAVGASLSAGQPCTVSVTFTPAFPGLRPGAVVLLDSGNNVLGTTYLAGTGQAGLAVLVPGNMIPVAGNGEFLDPPDNGVLATKAVLDHPSGVVLDGAGNMYIADSLHNMIRLVTASTGIISAFAGSGTQGIPEEGVLATSTNLNMPTGVALDGAGNLYIADTGNNAVRKVVLSTGIITTVAGNGSKGDSNANQVGDNGPAIAANLNGPWGVTVAANGDLYIADSGNNRIRLVDISTGIITTVAGVGIIDPNGSGTYSGDGQAATAAGINHPYAVAFDAAGDMYIPDSGNNVVRKVVAGIISTFAGTGAEGFGGDGGPAAEALLNAPAGVIVDAAQNLYISDTSNNAIRKVSTAGNITTIIRNGNGQYIWYTTPATILSIRALSGPIGLALDGQGNLYFADYLYMRVREVQGNVSLMDFTGTPVRNGDTSTPMPQMIENDGNAAVDLGIATAATNAKVDSASSTCGQAPLVLSVDESCIVGADFAPTASGSPLFGNITVAAQSVNAVNPPYLVTGVNPPYLNIVLAGDATARNSTTTVVTSNPNPSNFGQSVTFTVTVTTGTGTGALSGTVSILDTTTGTTLEAAGALNLSGVATFTISSLAVGSHNITASYNSSGSDVLHFASTSAPITQVVNEQTGTTLSSNPNPSAVGASVVFTAHVTTPNGGGVSTDGDTVIFTDTTAGAVLGSSTLLNGTATLSVSSLTYGSHAVVAAYGGNSTKDILGSVSNTVNQSVLASATTTVSSNSNPSVYGSAVTFTVTVSPSGSQPASGTADILDGGQKIGSATLATGSPATGTFTTSALVAGTHTITADYDGNSYYASGLSPAIMQTVTQAPTVTSVAATPNPGIAGKAVTLAAKVAMVSGSATPTGTFTFTDGTAPLGSANASGGEASIAPILAPGPHSIVVTYSGDKNDDSSVSAALPMNVIQATTAVAIESDANPSIVLSSTKFTATVTGNGGVPTGVVTFTADGTVIGVGTLSGGKTSLSTTALSVGTHVIGASYAGDADDVSSSGSLSQVVQYIKTATDLGSSATSGATPQMILVSTVVGASGPIPTGTVTFNNGSTVIGSSPLNASGIATLTPDLPAGTSYNIIANYGGDAIHSPSASSPVTISGTATGYSLTVDPNALSIPTTQNANVTITLTSQSNFSDTIGLGCSSLPAAINCHFSSNSVALKAGTTSSVQLTIDTNNPLSGGQTAMNTRKGGFSLAGLFLPSSVLFGLAFWRFRKRHSIVFTAILAVLLSGAMLATGCGGFSQSSASPGTYVIQVTGAGANSNITHFDNITLTITK